MAKAGRRSQSRKRLASGRPSRAGHVPAWDRGSERTMAMQALYGPDGSDALGRAYRAGLLGEGSDAKALLDTGRRIANAYWQAYVTGSYKCPLGDRTHGNIADMDHEKIKRREEWLRDCLAKVKHRTQFDALVIDVHPDSGPPYLDRLIYAHRTRKEPDALDSQRLSLAIKALAELVT